jgi:hypothetical protein
VDSRKQGPKNPSSLVSLASVLLLLNASLVLAQRPQVMDPTLPTGTIVGLNPEYPALTGVAARVIGETFVIEGVLTSPIGTFDPATPEYLLCRKPGARCAQFEVRFPAGYVVGGGFGFAVREQGSEAWIPLKTRRKTMVLRADRTFAATGAFHDEFEEFHGFSIEPFFATRNCAVKGREETAWAIRLWRPKSVSFRISIPLARCPDLKPSEDTPD